MSPGNQIRAETANNAKPNKATIRIGSNVVRKKVKRKSFSLILLPQTTPKNQPVTSLIRIQVFAIGIKQKLATERPIQPPRV